MFRAIGTCSTCRYWAGLSEGGRESPLALAVANCQRVVSRPSQDLPAYVTGGDDYYDAALTTRSDFGCTQWRPVEGRGPFDAVAPVPLVSDPQMMDPLTAH